MVETLAMNYCKMGARMSLKVRILGARAMEAYLEEQRGSFHLNILALNVATKDRITKT